MVYRNQVWNLWMWGYLLEMNKLLNNIVTFGIVLLVGNTIQKEIIKQHPELREEVRRQKQITFFVAILVCLLVLLGIYIFGGLK
jgi:hypothetical protein